MNCTHTVKCTPTTMFPEVKRVVKKLLKGNSFLLHENDPNGCSCCGGSVENLSLEELQEPMKDPDFLREFDVSKIYTWRFDNVKVYGVPQEIQSCTCDCPEYAHVNYIGKQFGRYFHGGVLLFKSKTHAETYIRQFRETKKEVLRLDMLVLERTIKRKQEELKQKQRLVQTKLNFSKVNEN
jgi:hypothetical protein